MNEQEFETDIVDFDANPYEVVLNNAIRVAGSVSVSMTRNDTAQDPLSDEPYRSILIEGVLATKYFEQDIEKIETRRYVIMNVDVYSEEFGSLEDEIIYRFKADAFRVKYQMTESPDERLVTNG